MEELICSKCNLPLEMKDVSIDYLDYHYIQKLPRCPNCGQIFISEELVDDKITNLESSLEEK